jgi:hypothetical protein
VSEGLRSDLQTRSERRLRAGKAAEVLLEVCRSNQLMAVELTVVAGGQSGRSFVQKNVDMKPAL